MYRQRNEAFFTRLDFAVKLDHGASSGGSHTLDVQGAQTSIINGKIMIQDCPSLDPAEVEREFRDFRLRQGLSGLEGGGQD